MYPPNGARPGPYLAPAPRPGATPRVAPTPEKTSRTARLLALTAALCILEGAGRKWLVYGSSPAVQGLFYGSKDVVMALAALAAGREAARSSAVRGITQLWALASLVVIVASLVTIADARPVGAVLSLRAMIVVPVLAMLAAPGLRSRRDVDLVVQTIGFLGIAVAALGVLQFGLPKTHFLNRLTEEGVYGIVDHGRVRATGTFAFVAGMPRMALAATWAGCYVLLAPPRRARGYLFILAGLACAASALSRSGLFFSVILIVVTLFLSLRGLTAGMILVVLVAGIGMALGENDEEEAGGDQQPRVGLVTGTLIRHRDGDSVDSRSNYLYGSVLIGLSERPFGSGLGTGQFGDSAATDGVRMVRAYEGELGRIVWEIGVLGLIGVALLRVGVIAVLWTSLFGHGREASPLFYLRRTALPALGMLFATNLVFDHVANTFAWVIIALALGTLEIEARQAVAPSRPRSGAGPGPVAYRGPLPGPAAR